MRDAIANAILQTAHWDGDLEHPIEKMPLLSANETKVWLAGAMADAVMGLLAEQPTIEVYVQSASEGTWAELGFGHGNEVSHRAIKAELGAGGGGRYALVRLEDQ